MSIGNYAVVLPGITNVKILIVLKGFLDEIDCRFSRNLSLYKAVNN